MLAQLLETGDAETALRVAGGSLSEYWLVAGGRLSERRVWLDRVLHAGEGASAAARAWGLYGVTILAVHQWDLAEARRAGTEGLALARTANDPDLLVQALLALCLVEQSDGRFEEAKALAEEALERARDRNDFGAMGWALQFLGSARSSTGDTVGAVAALEESLALFRQSGAVWGEADTLTILAAMARAEGEVTRAAHFYADSIRLRRDADELVGVYNDLVGLATIAREQGRGDAATRLLGADNVHRTRSGYEGFSETAQLRYQTRQALLEQLGEATFTREWETGRGFSTARHCRGAETG